MTAVLEWHPSAETQPRAMPSAGGSLLIGGYAAKFRKPSHNLGGFTEEIAPGAFSPSATAGWPGVVARFNHSDDFLLGTTRAGTLSLRVDRVGLRYEVRLPDSRADIYELVRRGDVAQSSFAFATEPNGDRWAVGPDGLPLRTLLAVRLHDVAPVVTPAYEDTSVGVRGGGPGDTRALLRRTAPPWPRRWGKPPTDDLQLRTWALEGCLADMMGRGIPGARVSGATALRVLELRRRLDRFGPDGIVERRSRSAQAALNRARLAGLR